MLASLMQADTPKMLFGSDLERQPEVDPSVDWAKHVAEAAVRRSKPVVVDQSICPDLVACQVRSGGAVDAELPAAVRRTVATNRG